MKSTQLEKEGVLHFDFPRSFMHCKSSFSGYLARRIGREIALGRERAPLQLIEKYATDAEEQFQALRFFYSCLFRKRGKKEEVKNMGGHNYQPLTESEKQKIMQLRIAGTPLIRIAESLSRHISTVFYFCQRENINRERAEGDESRN